MDRSRSIAGLVGPALLVIVVSELRIWNPTLYDDQIVPLVYLSGVLFFIAGLAIVRAHNIWVAGWPVVITVLGWLGMLLGISRAFFPRAHIAGFENDLKALVVEIALILAGAFLSFKAYGPRSKPK